MTLILRPFRLLGVAISVATFLGAMSLVWLFVRDQWKATRLATRALSWWSRRTLWVLGVRHRAMGTENVEGLGGALFVGNHLSYVDVLVIASYIPACFVTSLEIKNSPGLGLICRFAGCLFVDRKNKRNLKGEVGELQQALERGLKVAIFPEATSTNGEQILRFRRPLYLAALSAARPVCPFVLNYRRVGNQPIDRRSRDSIFWYGDMDFLPHLLRLTANGGVEVELNFLKPQATTPASDASLLAERTQADVEAAFSPIRA